MTPKECKWCGSIWHSKNKCPQAPNKPLKAVYKVKLDSIAFPPKNVSDGLKMAQKSISERGRLIADADKYFSIYVRQRGMDWAGYNQCYTCGVTLPWGQLQCGHFMSRRFMNTRWSLLNCRPQCNECNVIKQGNLTIYEKKLRVDYGDVLIDDLKSFAKEISPIKEADIKEIQNIYKILAFPV